MLEQNSEPRLKVGVWGNGCLWLRNHEVFKLDTSFLQNDPPILKILDGTKTGYHIAMPCPSHWADEMQIRSPLYPKIQIEGRSNNNLGEKISQEFYELKILFSPYALRHAYAIRTAVLSVDVAIASKWMGHSVAIHNRQYHRCLGERHHLDAYKLMVQAEKRLKGEV